MFVGDQRFTESDLQVYFDSIRDITLQINKDISFFCFGCLCRKKNDHQKVGAYDANVVFDEEDDRKYFKFCIFLIIF
jgi:hypothetical protein